MKQSRREEGELWPFPPPWYRSSHNLKKTLFNLNPLINISNRTSPSSEGEKEKVSLVFAHLLTARKEETNLDRNADNIFFFNFYPTEMRDIERV